MSEAVPRSALPFVTTGNADLDDILGGGLQPDRLYLIEGNPGSGKTTLALQFLLEGLRRGEPVLYVTLSETKEELHGVARSHGWSLDGIAICELIPGQDSLLMEAQTRIFHPSEVELGEATRTVLAEVERTKPKRVAFDSLSELRLLAQNPLRYRRQILALKQFFIGRQCTVLLLDDLTSEMTDLQLQSIAHGVVNLEHLAPEYGAERRRLRVVKMRGVKFRGGYHDFIIRRGGLDIFPRLIAAEHRRPFEPGQLHSGVAALDALLGGGLERGTSALLMGPAGSGKSTIAIQYLVAAAERGERSALFMFDETTHTLLSRSIGLGLDLPGHIKAGRIHVQQVDPAEMSPGEFAHTVRNSVEQDGAKVVVIDSLNGYMQSMPNERFLTIQLHELLTYLGQQGVVTFLVVAQHGLLGSAMQAPVDASYLADSVILLRFFEAAGKLRRAISVVKKRSGAHEDTLREMRMGPKGIAIGKALENFHGVLTGTPSLLQKAEGSDE
ncbi:MAG TPA: ATPase domain-containing protein [Gemmataceae bacterium]|jgi:circadian clock protein KaiC|nr:ATPase domain-containing protein [Gemmataceae bacterium]